MQSWVTQLRKGLVELSVLTVLEADEAYGYQILQRLGAVEALEMTESTLYPVLARLARDGLVRVRTAPSPAGPPRRYYRLTDAGEKRLGEMKSHWADVRDAVDHLLNGESHESSDTKPA